MFKNFQYAGEVVMEVKTLHEVGLMAMHNQRNPDAAVEPGDVILSVNGVHGDWNEMLAQFAKDSVVVEVERPLQPPQLVRDHPPPSLCAAHLCNVVALSFLSVVTS